jgi:hypothetical protein
MKSRKARLQNVLLSLKIKTGVFRSATIIIDELFPESVFDFDKVGLIVSRRETFGKLLERWGKAIVGFVTRSPKSVATSILGGLDNF